MNYQMPEFMITKRIHHEHIAVVLLVIMTLWSFFPVTRHDFINYDDPDYVVHNHIVTQGMTIDGVKWAFTSYHSANWHPVTWLSHMLDCQLYGRDAGKHHTTSLVFHIVNSVLVLFVFFRSTKKIWASIIVATFFAIHPMHVESVAWIAERKDVLSTFFMMIVFLQYISYVKFGRKSNYWLSLFFFVIGLMSKPMLVTVPFLLLLFDYWPLGRFESDDKSVKIPLVRKIFILVFEKVPFFVFTVISSLITIAAQKSGGAVMSLGQNPLQVRFFHVFISYVKYIKKMFFPLELAVHYPHPGIVSIPVFYFSFLLIASISLTVIYFFKRKPFLFTGWFWYLGTLVPVIGIVQVGGQDIADRYTYIPFIGLFVMIAWGAEDFFKNSQLIKKIMLTTYLLLVLTIAPITRSQVETWADSITLFQHALKVTNNNYTAHVNLGNAMLDLKKRPIEKALLHFQEAIRIDSGLSMAYISLGMCFQLKTENDKAIYYYKKAVEIDSMAEDAYYNLGTLYMNKGDYDEAIKYFNKTLIVSPDYARAYNGLGAVYTKMGYREKSLFNFRKAIDLGFDYSELDLQANKNASNLR